MDIDQNLRIVRRTLEVTALQVDQLSAGASEQLAVISRLWSRNQQLAGEIVTVLRGLDCTVYTARISKALMYHQMTQRTNPIWRAS